MRLLTWNCARGPRSRKRDALGATISLALLAAGLLLGACAKYLPIKTLERRAPVCGAHAIDRRPGDRTPTYFMCQVQQPVVTPGDRPLSYPPLLAHANVEGTVELQFVVDERGAVDSSTIVVLRTDHELFTRSARASLRAWAASPAVLHGKSVRQLMTHAFCFRLMDHRTPTVAPRCDDDLRRYGSADISRACENTTVTICSNVGGCRLETPPPRPQSLCP
jgi:TonB family protein